MIRMFIHLKFIMSLVQQGPITFTFGFIFFFKFYHAIIYGSIFVCLQLSTCIHDFFWIPINYFARFAVAAILDCYNSYCFGIMVGLSDHALQSWINHNDS